MRALDERIASEPEASLAPNCASKANSGASCRVACSGFLGWTLVDIKLMPVLQFAPFRGAIAQLGERLHGMQEVDGSIPSGSTRTKSMRVLACVLRPHRLEA